MPQDQKKAFLLYEANRWFERNRDILNKYTPNNDKIISLIKEYKIKPKRVLEVGCSAGYRLHGFRQSFEKNIETYGVEPSDDAINFGKEHYPEVEFIQGTVDNMAPLQDNFFDVVVVGFVFYVVDRTLLLKSIAEIDRVLGDNGFLVIVDFFSETTIKRNYHHISDFSAYSFKQRYDEVFTATGIYHLISRSCYNHDTGEMDGLNDFQDMYSISLLRKDTNVSYK